MWLLAEIVLDNRFMQKISSKLLSKQGETVDKAFSEYKQVLENVDLLWADPRTVFVTNLNSINRAKELMKEGNMDGKKCDALIRFLTDYRKSTGYEGIRCLDPAKSHNKTGLRFLWKRAPGPLLDVEEHYIYASLSSDCGRKALKAYSEACELMDLVEESDPATDILQSKAADSVFKALLEETAENAVDTTTVVYMEEVAATIEKLAEESKRKVEVIENGGNTLDWKKAGAANALYKLCKSIECSSTGNFMEVVNELQSALADIMGDCVESVGAVLVDNCTKWAQDFQQGKLLKAVYIAGKNTALLERLGLCPTMHICTTTTESSMV